MRRYRSLSSKLPVPQREEGSDESVFRCLGNRRCRIVSPCDDRGAYVTYIFLCAREAFIL